MTTKVRQLLPLLWRNPAEFVDRVIAVLDVKNERLLGQSPSYQSVDLEVAISAIDRKFNWTLAHYMAEAACETLAQHIRQATAALPSHASIPVMFNADFTLARTCYAVCRMLKPTVVIETGVAYGVTSAFILAALAENQHGQLYSIDLPPLNNDGDQFIGILVPAELRSRWNLHRGTSRRLLPELLAKLSAVDVFVHDSLHTRRNILFELDTISPHLNHPAAVLVDDANDNTAFAEWTQRQKPALAHVIQEREKSGLYGIAVQA
jgi:hypothetical protein